MQIIRSSRKTMGLEIKPDGTLLIRVPYSVSDEQVNKFVEKHKKWIESKQEKMKMKAREADNAEKLTFSDIQKLADKALKYIPERVDFYAPIVGVTYGRITIKNQKTRWGSCSSKGNLNFNCLLMLTPAGVIDSVVVHELCHRIEMNHSKKFYDEVYRVYPKYDRWNRWLKDNGPVLMNRMMQ